MSEIEKESLRDQATRLEEEARMVLPGVQATFGFQLIAVFNQRFESLSSNAQMLHFAALLASVMAAILIITPAAYHRYVERDQVSEYFVRLASRLLFCSLLPFAIGLTLDCYLIGRLVLHSVALSRLIAALVAIGAFGAWYGFPLWKRSRIKSSVQ
jgi:hypothetical protein